MSILHRLLEGNAVASGTLGPAQGFFQCKMGSTSTNTAGQQGRNFIGNIRRALQRLNRAWTDGRTQCVLSNNDESTASLIGMDNSS